MITDASVLKQLTIEVTEIDARFRECFESSMQLDYDAAEDALAGLARMMIFGALGKPFDTESDDVRRSFAAAKRLEKSAGKSLTKRRLLYTLAVGRISLDKVMELAEAGDTAAAISSLTAASMASGSVQVAASEIAAKAAPGKTSSAKRKETFNRLAEEAIVRWRADVPPELSASQAAEKLRAKGVPISQDKLARIISKAKKPTTSPVVKASPLKRVR